METPPMREKKISLLLYLSFLLLLASFLILCTWVYNYYSTNKEVAAPQKALTTRSEVTRDSLLKIYTSTIQSVESQLGNTYSRSDSLEASLDLKLNEYYRLKTEVAAILKNPTSTDDFKSAKLKISELQQRMEALRSTNSDVQKENARLLKLISQMNEGVEPNSTISTSTSTNAETPPRSPQVTLYTNTPFTTAEMNLIAVKPDDADEPDVFNTQRNILGSFAVKHNINLDNSELWVIVTQPNGKVLQKSAWESGSFTSNDGKKIYSLKMSFGYTKGEAKKFSFSLGTEKFLKGNYTMQIYNNGKMIGRITKSLS